ncbi:hypothetical protein DMP23_21340 [Amycolatopsis sp. A1MSW2902]|uniref:hypothetical protein n=1 Tax=Amycolatopsis sp. A1MSW2902 TaxID=687413 RepID=UPI00307D8779
MNADDDIPVPEGEDDGPQRSEAEIAAMVERLWSAAQGHEARIEHLHERLRKLEAQDESDPQHLARWLTFPAPPAAEDPAHQGETPLFTIACFVQYYNEVYVGRPGSRAVAIPDCWLNHPALLAEIATLTYTWRAAHLGRHASVREAQYWHDRWRPAFAERLATEWTHPHCLTATHKQVGSGDLKDRYTVEARSSPQRSSD